MAVMFRRPARHNVCFLLPLRACMMMWRRESSLPPGWRYQLYSPFSVYALSSFFISILGIQMLYQSVWCPDAAPGWPGFPHGVAEATWVIAQGAISYCSDGLYVGVSSWAHVADRSTAPLLFVLQVYKFCYLFLPWLTWPEKVWTWGFGLALGVLIKGLDNHAATTKNLELYRATHILWHAQLPAVFGAFNVLLVWRACAELL